MTPVPVEDQLRDLAQRARGDGEIPADVLHRVRRHRRRRQTLAAAGATVVVVLMVLVPLRLLGSGGEAHHRAVPVGRGPTPSGHPATAARAQFAPLPPSHTGTGAPEPKTMLTLIGGGGERLARVATATGTVTKWLQDTGSQSLMTFAPDLSTAYQPQLTGCRARWSAIDTDTGAAKTAFAELGGPLEVAIAADPSRVAYVSVGRQARVSDGRGGTMPAGCPTAPHALVVTDASTETTVTYPIAHYDESLYPAFDDTGTRLAFVWHRQVRVLDLNTDGALADAHALTPHLKRGCTQNKPLWRPGSDSVLVAEQCGQQSSIVGYDARSGEVTYRHHVPGPSIIGSFDTDASGAHVVYSISRLDTASASVYAVEPGGDRHLLDDAYQVAW